GEPRRDLERVAPAGLRRRMAAGEVRGVGAARAYQAGVALGRPVSRRTTRRLPAVAGAGSGNAPVGDTLPDRRPAKRGESSGYFPWRDGAAARGLYQVR